METSKPDCAVTVMLLPEPLRSAPVTVKPTPLEAVPYVLERAVLKVTALKVGAATGVPLEELLAVPEPTALTARIRTV